MSNQGCVKILGDSSTALNYRIGGLFGILFVSLIGFLLPTFFSHKKGLKFVYFLFQTFAAGVVIATGLVHVLPDAVASAANPCLNLPTSSFPWVFVITLHTTILTFMGEHALKRWMQHAWTKRQDKLAITNDEENEISIEKIQISEAELKERLDLQNSRVVAYTLEAGVVFHSIFVGLTLGTSHDTSFVKGLTFALLFHQGFEGIALGAAISKAKLGWSRTIIFGVAFALTTPVGVALGIIIGNSYDANSKGFLATEVAFNSMSAGILIYNGLVDIIVPTFEEEGSLALQSTTNTILGFFLMICGSSLMSFVAKWA